MNSEEVQTWIASLKPGDQVAIHELYGKRFMRAAEVLRITPTGTVVLVTGEVFRPDGSHRVPRNSCYAHRCIRPSTGAA